MVYQCEKLLSESGDKISEDDKQKLNPAVDALKEALKGEDTNLIKSRQDELTKIFYEVSEKIYKASAPEDPQTASGASGASGGFDGAGDGFNGASGAAPNENGGQDGYYDAPYTEV